jgi:hypothetical protein
MAITVLKVSKADTSQIEVCGEFWDVRYAETLANCLRAEDESDEFEYLVETPHVDIPPDANPGSESGSSK